jgi:hypothetical protein
LVKTDTDIFDSPFFSIFHYLLQFAFGFVKGILKAGEAPCPPLPEMLAYKMRAVPGAGRRVPAHKLNLVSGVGRRAPPFQKGASWYSFLVGSNPDSCPSQANSLTETPFFDSSCRKTHAKNLNPNQERAIN